MYLPFIVSISSVSHSKANCLQALVTCIRRPVYRVFVTMWCFRSPEFLTLKIVLHLPSRPICVTGCSLGRATVMVRGITGSGCGGNFSPGKGSRRWAACRCSLCRSGLFFCWPHGPLGLSNAVKLGRPGYVPREEVFLGAQDRLCHPVWCPTLSFNWLHNVNGGNPDVANTSQWQAPFKEEGKHIIPMVWQRVLCDPPALALISTLPPSAPLSFSSSNTLNSLVAFPFVEQTPTWGNVTILTSFACL